MSTPEFYGTAAADFLTRSSYLPDGDYTWSHVWGLAGDDRIIWKYGQIIGGPGNDTLIALDPGAGGVHAAYWDSPGPVTIDLEAGWADDGWGTRDTLVGIRGMGGSAFADMLFGSADNDRIDYTGGGDLIDGRGGFDVLWFNGVDHPDWSVTASVDLQTYTLRWGTHLDETVRLLNVEQIEVWLGGDHFRRFDVENFIDWSAQAAAALAGGARWNVAAPLGSAVELSYSFMAQRPSYGDGGGGSGFVPLNSAQQGAVRSALAQAAEVSGLALREVADGGSGGQLRFGINQQAATKGYAFGPDAPGALAGDVWLDVETAADLAPGTEGWWVLLHEIGHALGLRHAVPFGTPDVAVLTSAVNDWNHTVMAEAPRFEGAFPVTFGMFDIAALRHLYGVGQAHAGDTTHGVGAGRSSAMLTVVDSGGFDVLDASVSRIGVEIHLKPGSLSSVGRGLQDQALIHNLGIAFGSIIEKIVGSAFDDLLTGTDGDEWFVGGDGNDEIDGDGGLDTAVYAGQRAAYEVSLSSFSGRLIVAAHDGESGADTLAGIERLQFADRSLAFDLDGHAGHVARLLGAVFGPAAVSNAEYAGIGIGLLDGGMSPATLTQLALDVRLGAAATSAVLIDLLYTNLLGQLPSADELGFWTGTLERGEFTPVSLAQLAADTALNAERIGLVGLADNGLEYTG